MKRFKKKISGRKQFLKLGILIGICVIFFLYYFSVKWSKGIINISKLKVNEVTTNIVNDAVLNYKKSGVELNNLIKTNINNKNEIISVDVDMEKGYELMEGVVGEIRKNIRKFQETDYEYYNMESLYYDRDSIVIMIPMGAITGQNLIVNLGPKVPVKLSLLENVKGSIRTEVQDYGINNSLVNVYLKIEIEQNIEMPSATDSFFNKEEMLVSSKLIYGTVPNFIGNFKDSESEIVNIPVK